MDKRNQTELTEGLNTYRIHPILMSDRDANDLFENLQRKKDCGEPLTKEDLVPLTLSLLMGGAMPMEDRVTQTFRYLQEEPLEKEDQQNRWRRKINETWKHLPTLWPQSFLTRAP